MDPEGTGGLLLPHEPSGWGAKKRQEDKKGKNSEERPKLTSEGRGLAAAAQKGQNSIHSSPYTDVSFSLGEGGRRQAAAAQKGPPQLLNLQQHFAEEEQAMDF